MKVVEVSFDDDRLLECQKQYFQEISLRFDQAFDPYAGEANELDMVRQWHVLALDGSNAIGCGSLRDLGHGYAEVKRVWTSNSTRGLGIGKSLMDWLEEKARSEKFTAIRLDTNRVLSEAQSMYRKRGYKEIDRYNDNPYADHFFEKFIG